ncbi:MAG: transporter substrate-binding domain-containing protein [Bacillota bacterium]
MQLFRRFTILTVTLVTIGMLAACGEEDTNELVVGIECDYAPYNWTTNSDDGLPVDGQPFNCDGYDVTLAEIIAEDLGRDLVIKKVNWDGLPVALQAGSIDVIIAGMSPTEERRETMLFSDAYFVSEQVVVVRTDSDFASATTLNDLDGARVIAQTGTLQNDLISQIPNADHQDPLGTYSSLVEQVRSGASDALIAELTVAMSIINGNDDLMYIQLDDGFELDVNDISTSVAMQLGEDDLLADINDILATISQEDREAYMQAALERSAE